MKISEKQIRQIIREVIKEGFVDDLKGAFSSKDKLRKQSIDNMVRRVVNAPPKMTKKEENLFSSLFDKNARTKHGVDKMSDEQKKEYFKSNMASQMTDPKELEAAANKFVEYANYYLEDKPFYKFLPKYPFDVV